jgi:hypothetical protein
MDGRDKRAMWIVVWIEEICRTCGLWVLGKWRYVWVTGGAGMIVYREIR